MSFSKVLHVLFYAVYRFRALAVSSDSKLILIRKKLIDILEFCQVSLERVKTQIKVPVYAKQHNTINPQVHSRNILGKNCKKRSQLLFIGIYLNNFLTLLLCQIHKGKRRAFFFNSDLNSSCNNLESRPRFDYSVKCFLCFTSVLPSKCRESSYETTMASILILYIFHSPSPKY